MRGRSIAIVYAITPPVAYCSLLYELLIAQALTILAANAVVWYSLTIGIYVGAMGLAALLFDRLPRLQERGWHSLFWVELGLSVCGALAVLLIHLAHTLHLYLSMEDAALASKLVFFCTSTGVTILVGVLTGIELPLLIQLGNELAEDRTVTNRVLGLDYIGALAAGVGFPMLLLPRFELVTIGFLTALINLFAACVLLYLARSSSSQRGRVATAALVGFAILLGLSQGRAIQQYFLKQYYFYFEASESLGELFGGLAHRPEIVRTRSPYQRIDMVHDEERSPIDYVIQAYSTKLEQHPDFPRDRYLFLNGDFQLSSNHEERYHEWFAHVPLLMHGEIPERVLVLGAGDGLLLRELVKYPGIQEIVHVDLDPTLVEMAREHPVLTGMNRRALEDPRVDTRVGDGYQFLRRTEDVFDAIFLDFPDVVDYNLSKLYSREFYHFVTKRLAEDGFAAADALGVDQGRTVSAWDVYFHTLRAAGFGTVVPYSAVLEKDNPQARPRLLEFYADEDYEIPAPEEFEEVFEGTIRSEQGFLAMWKTPERPIRSYRDFGVPMNIVNRERYALTVSDLPRWDEIDYGRVNSIMRPTLPRLPVWFIRKAWSMD